MRTVLLCVAVCWLAILAGCATQQVAEKGEKLQYVETDTGRWLIHDMNRPAPTVISPGTGPGRCAGPLSRAGSRYVDRNLSVAKNNNYEFC